MARSRCRLLDETNRLNYAQRCDRTATESKLAKIKKAKTDIIDAIENGRYDETWMDRLLDGEGLEGGISGSSCRHTGHSSHHRRNLRQKFERLAEALNCAEDRDKAEDTICGLIEWVTLTTGAKRGEVHVTLQGEFGAIVEWLGALENKVSRNDDSPVACATGLGVSWKLVAGTGFEPVTFRL